MDALEVGVALIDHAVARPHEHPDLLDMPWRHPRLWQPFGHEQVSEVPRINTRRPLSPPEGDPGLRGRGTLKRRDRQAPLPLGVNHKAASARCLQAAWGEQPH